MRRFLIVAGLLALLIAFAAPAQAFVCAGQEWTPWCIKYIEMKPDGQWTAWLEPQSTSFRLSAGNTWAEYTNYIKHTGSPVLLPVFGFYGDTIADDYPNVDPCTVMPHWLWPWWYIDFVTPEEYYHSPILSMIQTANCECVLWLFAECPEVQCYPFQVTKFAVGPKNPSGGDTIYCCGCQAD